jgi:hypothetical protein
VSRRRFFPKRARCLPSIRRSSGIGGPTGTGMSSTGRPFPTGSGDSIGEPLTPDGRERRDSIGMGAVISPSVRVQDSERRSMVARTATKFARDSKDDTTGCQTNGAARRASGQPDLHEIMKMKRANGHAFGVDDGQDRDLVLLEDRQRFGGQRFRADRFRLPHHDVIDP